MRKPILKSSLVALCAVILIGCTTAKKPVTTLKEALKDKFYIGTALNTSQTPSDNPVEHALITSQFNAIVAENCMKSEKIQPQQGVFTFDDADRFVKFGEDNNLWITGHTLIWHSQAPKWLFVDAEGNDVSRDTLIARMKTHIHTLVGRYKGRVKGWDVVNEAIEDNGEYRNSKFYQIIGEEYIELAFQFAREADPETELYYNDYSMANPGRREGVVKMVKGLQAKGIKVDAIGMQGHLNIDVPDINEFEKSIVAFSELGVKVMITEMDITVLPWPSQKVTADVSTNFELKAEYNPFPDGLTAEMSEKLNNRYTYFFKLFLKHSDKISRVTLWGVHDNQTWRNNWPIFGRKDYPLLFDRDLQPKPAVARIIEAATAEKNDFSIKIIEMANKARHLIKDIYTADPRAHVYNGKIYIFPSHDIESGIAEDDTGAHFDMKDYHVYSMEDGDAQVVDHGVALDIKDVPWAKRQMWSNDVACKDGKYYMYFPAKDHDDIFRIGVAVSDKPEGPYKAMPEPMKGGFSIDQSVFVDDDGTQYLYWGGIWGGQLQRYKTGKYEDNDDLRSPDESALTAKVAKLSDNMLEFGEEPHDVVILDSYGNPLLTKDENRRFFEASWMHKYNGKYYFSYSTGNTHLLCYAIGDNPYGPFTYQGVILTPVVGWTTHHSIVEFKGKWYLFHHDSKVSGGKTWLRSMKIVEITYREDGTIETIDGNADE